MKNTTADHSVGRQHMAHVAVCLLMAGSEGGWELRAGLEERSDDGECLYSLRMLQTFHKLAFPECNRGMHRTT